MAVQQLEERTYLNQSFDLILRELLLLPRFQKLGECRQSDDLRFGGVNSGAVVDYTGGSDGVENLLFVKIPASLVLMGIDGIVSC